MIKKLFLIIVFLLIATSNIFPCTNYIVTKGASKDGSVMLFYTCDGQFLYNLKYYPAKDYKPGDSTEFRSWGSNVKGKIKEAAHTYAHIGFHMNEYQLSIGETTFGGRKELINDTKFLHYGSLMRIALQRAKTAREAIKVMTDIAEEYGYASEGETFSIADTEEAWIMEMVGTGKGGEGAVWVARKIPDGMICAHANMSRIGEFPLNDPENCLYSKNVISFAIEKGYYNPDSGEPFRFNDAYDPINPKHLRYCATRVWSLYNKTCPNSNFSIDFSRGVKNSKRYPLWIKPEKKLSLQDVMNIVRDHYEGTEIDMTKGLIAGPFGCPNRLRPLAFKEDSTEYTWERPVSTYNAGFSIINQSRSWLPNSVGGVVWFGQDDNYTTCYQPLYCGINKIPESLANGDMRKFSWDCQWWVINFVSNFSNLRYSYMIKDIQKVQNSLETKIISEQDSIVEKAVDYYKSGKKEKLRDFLTEYSLKQSSEILNKWTDLAYLLISKYNDGFIKEDGKPYGKQVGYPDEWNKKIINDDPERYKIPVWKN